ASRTRVTGQLAGSRCPTENPSFAVRATTPPAPPRGSSRTAGPTPARSVQPSRTPSTRSWSRGSSRIWRRRLTEASLFADRSSPRIRALPVTEKLGGYASIATSTGRSTGAATLKSWTALAAAVGRLVDAAAARVLLGDDRIKSAGEGKLRLTGSTGTEELADKVQRVVVLATPIVRAVARGAKFTRLPWAMIASSSFSVGVAVRTGVRE